MSQVSLTPGAIDALSKLIRDLETAGGVYGGGKYTYPLKLELPLHVCTEDGVRVPGRITCGPDDRLVWKTQEAGS
jgi:hypothetical protein